MQGHLLSLIFTSSSPAIIIVVNDKCKSLFKTEMDPSVFIEGKDVLIQMSLKWNGLKEEKKQPSWETTAPG